MRSQADLILNLSKISKAESFFVEIPNLSHFVYDDLRAISRIGYEMFGWQHTPYSGSWPGSYNFNSFSPPDYFRQVGNINVAPSLDLMQQFRALDFYLQYNPSRYLTPDYMQQYRAPDNYYLGPSATLPQIQQSNIIVPNIKLKDENEK
ncbi:MAG: hypothetical protein WC442_02030 [Candidatus Omnitrophota bacterium]